MNLFLVPAKQENVKATIQNKVSLNATEKLLGAHKYAALTKALGNSNGFHCWAMTEAKRSTFNSMEAGDVVLLSIRGTGRFNYAGLVVAKLESEQLGKALWSFVPGEPWNLIYVLSNLREIDISKEAFVTAMGYEPNYVVSGAVRVTQNHVDHILARYGSILGLLKSFDIDLDNSDPALLGTTELENQIRRGSGFGDPETNRKVEKAAISCATRWYESRGWSVKSVEATKCGYDLLCTKSNQEEHVEVKGVQGSVVSFPITAGEVRQAQTNRNFYLFVVTLALSKTPEFYRYSADEFMDCFDLGAIAFRATLCPHKNMYSGKA